MAWLLDTNILSELRRPRPEPKVVDFIERKPLRELYISVVTIEGRVIQVQIDIVAETGFPRFMKKILEELKTFRDRIKDLRPRLLEIGWILPGKFWQEPTEPISFSQFPAFIPEQLPTQKRERPAPNRRTRSSLQYCDYCERFDNALP